MAFSVRFVKGEAPTAASFQERVDTASPEADDMIPSTDL
jgi:hypothetical protein